METVAAKVVGRRDGKVGFLGSIGVRFMIDVHESHGAFSLVEHPMSCRALAAPLTSDGTWLGRWVRSETGHIQVTARVRRCERFIGFPDFPLKVISWLVGLSTVVVLAGCGGGTANDHEPATGAASPPDSLGLANAAGSARKPCEYMARADAEAAVGQALPKTTEHVPLGMCDYNTPEFYGASLTVGDWESIRAAAISGGPSRQPTVISGVGDEALNLNGANGSNLYVRKGVRGFLLTLNGPHIDGLPDHGLEQEKTLALKILPNL